MKVIAPYFEILEDLDKVGIAEKDSLLILISDHGEGRREYYSTKSYGHTGKLTQDLLRVPFLVVNGKSEVNTKLWSTTNIKSIAIFIIYFHILSIDNSF